jgi:hypothetical protein
MTSWLVAPGSVAVVRQASTRACRAVISVRLPMHAIADVK